MEDFPQDPVQWPEDARLLNPEDVPDQQDRKPEDVRLSRLHWAILNLLLYAALAWMLWDTYQLQKLISK